jgi:hypothetical protein
MVELGDGQDAASKVVFVYERIASHLATVSRTESFFRIEFLLENL